MKKTGSLSVKVGEYDDKDGKKKGRYKTIGRLMSGDSGEFILLDATIISMQLFALANPKRLDSIIVSIFRDEKNGGGSAGDAGNAGDGGDVPF